MGNIVTTVLGFFAKGWLPMLIGGGLLATVGLGFNKFLNDRDTIATLEAQKEIEVAKANSKIAALETQKLQLEQDIKAREEEAELKSDRETLNDDAVTQAKRNEIIRKAYETGLCDTPGYTWW